MYPNILRLMVFNFLDRRHLCPTRPYCTDHCLCCRCVIVYGNVYVEANLCRFYIICLYMYCHWIYNNQLG
jgi:hypothetical protein